jgi:hypothetical protein
MSSDDSLRGHFLRNIRRPIEKAKSIGATAFTVPRTRREAIELEIGDLELMLELAEEDRAKLVNTEINRDQMLGKLHAIYAAIERGWPGLLDAMVDPVAALDIIANPSKLADWRRSQPIEFSATQPGRGWIGGHGLSPEARPAPELRVPVVLPTETMQALAVLEPRGWHVHEDAGEREPWAASNGDMTAIAPTPELLLRAISMCSAECCPVVHIQADGRLACECDNPEDPEHHDMMCPLSQRNTASYTYAAEVGQA